MEILRRELIYLWYYFSVQFEQIFGWWVLGMVIGSAVSVFAKDYIHRAFRSLQGKRLGILGVVVASVLGIASPLCMYGTIPIAASFSRGGMKDDWLAAFMMSSILLNPQLIIYSAALGGAVLTVRIVSSEQSGHDFCGDIPLKESRKQHPDEEIKAGGPYIAPKIFQIAHQKIWIVIPAFRFGKPGKVKEGLVPEKTAD